MSFLYFLFRAFLILLLGLQFTLQEFPVLPQPLDFKVSFRIFTINTLTLFALLSRCAFVVILCSLYFAFVVLSIFGVESQEGGPALLTFNFNFIFLTCKSLYALLVMV